MSRQFFAICIIFLFLGISRLNSQSSENQLAFAFRSQNSLDPSRMIVIGEVIGVEKASDFESNKVDAELEIDTRPDAVTIKVMGPKGIRVGQTLYLLEKNLDHKTYRDGNIVGLITVKSVFLTSFFGWQVRGEGFLRLIEDRPMTVAIPIDNTKYDEAFLSKKKGDYFVAKGKFDEAIQSYKKSISLDSKDPDTHFALGKVHLMDGEGYVSAGFEFLQAWKNRERFSNQQEKLIFLVEYMRFLIHQFKTEGKGYDKSLSRLTEVSKEARLIQDKNFEVWLYSFEIAYLKYRKNNSTNSEERKEKEQWSEEAETALGKALRIRKADFYLQRLACEFYNLKWKEMRSNPKENEYRDKLISHGRDMKLYYTGDSTISQDLLKAIHEAEKSAGLLR